MIYVPAGRYKVQPRLPLAATSKAACKARVSSLTPSPFAPNPVFAFSQLLNGPTNSSPVFGIELLLDCAYETIAKNNNIHEHITGTRILLIMVNIRVQIFLAIVGFSWWLDRRFRFRLAENYSRRRLRLPDHRIHRRGIISMDSEADKRVINTV